MSGGNEPQEFPFRARRILYAVVSEYVATGEPVGSRTLAKRYGLNISPATIRNTLADLEDWGYLYSPHTSAGRVPSERGFRVFVDALMQMREVGPEDRSAIRSWLHPRVEDVKREAGRVLSQLSSAASIVVPPRAGEEAITQLRFIPLRAGELLAVLVSRAGEVQNRAIKVVRDLEPGDLERLHNYLHGMLGLGLSLEALRRRVAGEIEQERDQYDAMRVQARQMLDATLGQPEAPTLMIEGQGLLFDRPEFANSEKIKSFLRAFEDKGALLELLERTVTAGGVQVLIGAEAASFAGTPDISVISAPYGGIGGKSGTVGVIGPARMDFAKLVPIVGYTAQVMSEVLEEQSHGGSGLAALGDDPEHSRD